MSRKNVVAAVVLLLGCAGTGSRAVAGDGKAAAASPVAEERAVDLCLCLDTSNSMDGLIDAAKRRLWDVVNDLARARPVPRLRVALLSYGNNGYPKDDGWVRTDAPFTEDLDFISEKLFALKTWGGEEYVGRVLDTSIARLAWSDDPKALRIAIVAGNESADQDRTVAFRDASAAAAKRGIVVNAIYCGDPGDGIAPGWRELAKLAEGEFAAIDQDRQAPVCATPYDALLATLSTSLNATYLPFGKHGAVYCANQWAQDANAGGLGAGAAASRAATKASSNYRNGSWDLVDAVRTEDLDLAKVPAEELPEALRKLTAEERKKYVADMAAQRAEIQAQIADLDAKRRAFLAEQATKAGAAEDASLAGAVRRAVRKQAERKGFSFAEK